MEKDLLKWFEIVFSENEVYHFFASKSYRITENMMMNIALKNDAGDYYKLEFFNETWIKNLSNCWVMVVNRAHQAQNSIHAAFRCACHFDHGIVPIRMPTWGRPQIAIAHVLRGLNQWCDGGPEFRDFKSIQVSKFWQCLESKMTYPLVN